VRPGRDERCKPGGGHDDGQSVGPVVDGVAHRGEQTGGPGDDGPQQRERGRSARPADPEQERERREPRCRKTQSHATSFAERPDVPAG
jgi:hypothetical protein